MACRCPSWRFRVKDRRSRRSLLYGLCSFLNHPHKADAFARDRADQPLLVAIVINGGPRRIDAGGERKFRHDAPAPDRSENIVLADDAVAVGDEIFQ